MFLVPLSSEWRAQVPIAPTPNLTYVTDMYTFKSAQRTRSSARLRRVALRTFIGAVCTLTSSVV